MLTHWINTIPILELLGLAKKVVRLQNGYYRTDCPACNDDIRIIDTSLVCRNRDCDFRSGNVYDLLAHGPGFTYAEAVRLSASVVHRYPSLLEGLEFEEKATQIVEELEHHRHVYNFILRLFRQRKALPDTQLTYLRAWCHKQGIGGAAADWTIFPCGREEILSHLGSWVELKGFEHGALLIPFWADHGTIARVLLCDPMKLKQEELIIQHTRFSYAGLLQGDPEFVNYVAGTRNPFSAATANYKLQTFCNDRVVLAVKAEPNLDSVFVPDGMIVRAAPDTWDVVQAFRAFGDDLQFTTGDLDAVTPAVDWLKLLENLLHSHLNSGRLSQAGRSLFSSLRMSDSDRQHLIRACRQAGMDEAATALTKVFSNTVLAETDKLKITAAPGGYRLCKKKDGTVEAITNFKLALQRNVVFRETGALYHAGSIAIEAKSFPFLVSSRDIENSSALEAALQHAVIRQAGTDSNIPMIRDKASFKLVVGSLRETSMTLPTVDGISRLGWADDRRHFWGPDWRTSMDGLKEGIEQHFHPDGLILQTFHNRTRSGFITQEVADGWSRDCRDVAAMLLACVARAFMNYPLNGVLIKHVPSTQVFMEDMFSALGQLRGVARLPSSLTAMGDTKGYPVLAYNCVALQLKRLEAPVFSISEHGITLRTGNTLGGDVGAYVRAMMPLVCDYMLATSGEDYPRARHILHATELAEEGSRVIEKITGMKWGAPSVQFKTVEKILAATTYADLPKLVLYDNVKQRLRIKHSLFPDLELPLLDLELRSLATHCIVDDTTAEIDAVTGFAILAQFYGKEPELPFASASKH